MNFKDMLSKISQLSEATEKTKTGVKHTAEPGGYGRKDDEDDEGKKVKSDAPKKGRGRPKKNADADTGEEKKYDTKTLGSVFGGGSKPKKEIGKVSKKNKLKEYFDQLDQALNEAEQIQIKPASQVPQKPGQPGQQGQQQASGQAQKNTQVIQQGNKTLGTVDNPQLAQQIKQSIGKGEMTLMPGQEMEEGLGDMARKVGGAVNKVVDRVSGKTARDAEAARIQKRLASRDTPSLASQLSRSNGDQTGVKDPQEYDRGQEYDRISSHNGRYGESVEEGFGDMARKVVDRVTGKTARDAEEARIQKRLNRPSLISQMRSPEGEQNRIDSRNQEQEFDRLSMGDRYAESAEEGLGGMARKVGGALKTGAKAVAKAIVGKDDAELLADLKHRAGVSNSQNGKPSMAKSNEEVEEASYSAKAARAGHDIGKPGKNFEKIATGAGGGEKGKRIAGAVLAKLRGKTNEADIPPNDSTASPLTLEAKGAKPDFTDVDDDNNTKESWKKAEQDKKKVKTKVKEGMDHRLKAARHAGKSHALGKQGYNCTYDDMEESKHYHEGYKEGLDECYDQMPIQGYVGEVEGSMPAATVPGMASQEQHGGMDEGNAFTAALKRTPTGGKFSVGGNSFTDRSSIEESPFAFEAWDNQLNALLEGKEVNEGMTVSISKGNEGSPDSVSVSAQDGEADQLLQLIKSAGLGLFGGDEAGQQLAQPSSMSLQPTDGGEQDGAMEIGVIDDHDGMMDLIKKVTGGTVGPQGGEISSDNDYEGEEGESEEGHSEEGDSEEHDHEHTNEEDCNECGMAYESCECDDKEVVDEVESEDQMTYQMAEDNPPDSGAEETEAEDADVAATNAAGAAYNPKDDVDESESTDEEQINEWANEAGKKGTDAAFESDIEFMMNVISGGLNKRKSTGQTTIPVVASQLGRQVARETTDINESVSDWKKLAGLK
jgi:hypothetical protein